MVLLLILAVLIIPLILFKIYALLTYYQCKSYVCLSHKTALVTGGNSGIGYQIVLALASRGCRVIIADRVRDPNLEETIFQETNNSNIVFKYVDLASFNSVRKLAKDLLNSEEKLDILINNAGIGRTNLTITEDGLDMTMQVNYFSPFLLTHLLSDLLKKSSGRIIFTSSYLSFISNLTEDKMTLTGVANSDPFYSYPNSKLGLIIIADIFAEKLRKYGVTSNSFHPGVVYTNIFINARHNNISNTFNVLYIVVIFLELLAFLIGKTPQEGAQTAVYLACAKEVKNVTGNFFGEAKSTFKPWKAYDKKLCQAIWNASEELVKLEPQEKI